MGYKMKGYHMPKETKTPLNHFNSVFFCPILLGSIRVDKEYEISIIWRRRTIVAFSCMDDFYSLIQIFNMFLLCYFS